jgi:phage gp16-like protein
MTAARANAPRRSGSPLLAKIHIAQKELNLTDEHYRDILDRVAQQRTAAGLSDEKLLEVLAALKALGWKPKVIAGAKARSAPKPGRRPADHPVARKARALWISLHKLGVIENGSEAALEAFAKRQLGVDALQWADQSQAEPLIKALKAMAERAGWSQSGKLPEILARLDQLLEAKARG